MDGFRFDLAASLGRAASRLRPALARSWRRSARTRCSSQVKLIAEPWDIGWGGYDLGQFPAGWSEWNGKYRDTVRDFWRGTDGHAARLRDPHQRLARPVRPRRPAADRVGQHRHRPRRLHARRPRQLQRQAQRGQRRGQPRRHRRQPQLELRRRGPDRRPRGARAARAAAAQLPRDADALRGRAAAARRRRVRAQPGRQQQRLLPGQRAHLVRLERGRGERATWSSSPPACAACASSTRCSAAASSSTGTPAHETDRDDLDWYRPDGSPMTGADWGPSFARAVTAALSGATGDDTRPDQPFLMLLNAWWEPLDFTFPSRCASAVGRSRSTRRTRR